MGFNYLRIAREESGRIHAIVTYPMELNGGPTIHRLSDFGGSEREMLKFFVGRSTIWRLKWSFLPVGINLDEPLRVLHDRSIGYGLVEFGAKMEKPTLDLFPLLAMFNMEAPRPDGALGDIPTCFYNASLEKFTQRRIGSGEVSNLLKLGRLEAVDNILRREFEAFRVLWDLTRLLAPTWWKASLQPLLPREGEGSPQPPT